MSDNGKIALITGAGSGVGRSCSLALLREGWTVVLAGRRLEALEETRAGAGDDAGRALAVPTDVGDEGSVTALFEKVEATHGRLDLLFNNAGGNAPSTPIDELTLDQWRSVIDINLTGVFLCTRAAVRLMKTQTPRGGRIVNNGSISAHVPRPGSAPYTSSKHAVSGLTKSTALDCRAHDIAVGQLDIGNAATPMTERMAKGVPQADGSVAVEPTMDPEHVAQALVYMGSLPLDANVHTITVMATKMPFVGRG